MSRIHNPLELLAEFAGLRALVIGDAMLDRQLHGSVRRLAPEAAVPVVDVEAEDLRPGGAANAVANAAALGAAVSLVSVVGDDDTGRRLTALLNDVGVTGDGLVVERGRRTQSKNRVVAHSQLVVRYDRGDKGSIGAFAEERLCRLLPGQWDRAEVVIVSDYGYGVLSDRVRDVVRRMQHEAPRTLLIDAKELTRYRDVRPTAVKPNFPQAAELLALGPSLNGDRPGLVTGGGQALFRLTGAEVVAVTMDTDGAVVLERGGDPYRTYSGTNKAGPPVQASGAGDTFGVSLALGLAAGGHTGAAAEVASAAASVVVDKHDSSVPFPEEVLGRLAAEDKRLDDWDRLAERIGRLRSSGRRLVFTNGVFDILHAGHIAYLNRAKQFGDILLIAVNSDESVKRLKGPDRPINTLDDRIRVLAGLSAVDALTPFSEDTPVDLVRLLRPDVYVKGGDYTRESLPEAPVVEELGGRVEIVPFVADRSTTATIDRVAAARAEGGC